MKDASVVEKLAAEVHGIYCKQYEKNFGKPYKTGGDYSMLDEPTKDYDRAFVRWHLERLLEDRKDMEEWCKQALDNHESRLTVHILRNWDREKLERFCLHLLGDKWQNLTSQLEAAEKEISFLKSSRSKWANQSSENADQFEIALKSGEAWKKECFKIKSELEAAQAKLSKAQGLEDAIRKHNKCSQCGGTRKTNSTKEGISKYQTNCWVCKDGLESWASEALALWNGRKG